MIESVFLIVIALVLAIPTVNVAARMVCHIYFRKKGEYQRALIHDLEKERTYGTKAKI